MKAKDEIAATTGGRGRLRASDGDRDRVLDMLKAAFVQGRLTRDELDMRVGQTLESRTWGDLTALTDDIPAWPIPGVARRPARAPSRPSPHSVARAVACAIIALAALALAGMPGVWTMPAPASLTAQACQTFFRWEASPAGSVPTLDIAAVTAFDSSDPKLGADLQTLLAVVRSSEFSSGRPESSATRYVVGHQTQADMIRVQSDCMADGNPPPVP